VDQRLDELEGRLRAAEDQLDILRLLNRYGPLVDSGSAAEAADLWVTGGGYDFTGVTGDGTRVEAPRGLAALYEGDVHAGLVAAGVAHLTATPHIDLHGETADAVGYSLVIRKEDDRWFVWRAAINHWALARTADGWRITERYNRVLDGSAESRATMRRILASP
jgi:hypothetical protein